MDMLAAMRHMPHWQPVADHLFEYTCAPTKVAYAKEEISYTVSCAAGREVLKVTFAPKAVTAGGKPLPQQRGGDERFWYDAATGLLVVQHSLSGAVHVQG